MARRNSTPEDRQRKREAALAVPQDPEQSKGPARGYSWKPFEKGNTAGLIHGAGTARHMKLAAPREAEAMELAKALLGMDELPEYMCWPQFRPQVESWARHEIRAKALHEWLQEMPVEEQVQPQGRMVTTTPLELWLAAERGAERARDKLGLTPASWAKIQRDLGLAKRAEEDQMARLAAQGRAIRAQREATFKVIRGDGDEG